MSSIGPENRPEDDGLYEHYQFTASESQKPLRVDKFLMNFIENATRSKIQQNIKKGFVWVNGEVVKSNHKVKGGDDVKVMLDHPSHENLIFRTIFWSNTTHYQCLVQTHSHHCLVLHPYYHHLKQDR